MVQYAAVLYALISLGVILFQVGLIAGLPWGHLTQGGRFEGALPTSGRIAAGCSIVLLACMAYSVVSLANLVPPWPLWTAWITCALQVVSMLVNWITPSRPERLVWGPITTLMCVLMLVVFLDSR